MLPLCMSPLHMSPLCMSTLCTSPLCMALHITYWHITLEYCILADAYSIHWVFGVSLRCSRVITQVDSHIASCLYILSQYYHFACVRARSGSARPSPPQKHIQNYSRTTSCPRSSVRCLAFGILSPENNSAGQTRALVPVPASRRSWSGERGRGEPPRRAKENRKSRTWEVNEEDGMKTASLASSWIKIAISM